jgi:hypothetical protein
MRGEAVRPPPRTDSTIARANDFSTLQISAMADLPASQSTALTNGQHIGCVHFNSDETDQFA